MAGDRRDVGDRIESHQSVELGAALGSRARDPAGSPAGGDASPTSAPPTAPLPLGDVERLLRAAAKHVVEAQGGPLASQLYEAEQTELLVRLAADSGARRGGLAALQVGDIVGRVLHICRNIWTSGTAAWWSSTGSPSSGLQLACRRYP